jgi:hypothetical protein
MSNHTNASIDSRSQSIANYQEFNLIWNSKQFIQFLNKICTKYALFTPKNDRVFEEPKKVYTKIK